MLRIATQRDPSVFLVSLSSLNMQSKQGNACFVYVYRPYEADARVTCRNKIKSLRY